MKKAMAENAAVDLDYEIYNVVKGDLLWKIASDKLGNGARHNEIKELNGLNSDILSRGQKLKIPK